MSRETTYVSGLVATTPRHLITADGLPITSFRLAVSAETLNHSTGNWVEETNWYTITAFKQLAINTAGSVNKGERVIVAGKLRVRDWDNGERAGTSVEIEADLIGHDLTYGTAVFKRTILLREPEEHEPMPTTASTELEPDLIEIG
jgi:single-strand DNA-binding protein